jgi:hypothetical protein
MQIKAADGFIIVGMRPVRLGDCNAWRKDELNSIHLFKEKKIRSVLNIWKAQVYA